jgi:phosphatidylglycerophosphatase A
MGQKDRAAVIPAGFLRDPTHLIALGFGTGCACFAPGTWGSLVGVGLLLIMQSLPIPAYIGVIILFTWLGVRVCQRTAEDLRVHDHPAIVWDEVVGYLITMIMVPVTLGWVIYGFLLFRVFDIWKPWPIATIDKNVSGGLGIMLDDVLAGIYALIVMTITRHILTPAV